MFFTLATAGQYQNDNVLYKTVYLEDLCNTLKNNPGSLLLDVRSEGENHDTSSFANLNIGHLKAAKNISVQDLQNRLAELSAYRNKPVFVYCSHSQRSRRASKLLSDSGFTNVFNINGGLTTLHYLDNTLLPCDNMPVEMNTDYKLVSPSTLFNNSASKGFLVVDIRNDSVFKGNSEDEKKLAGGKLSTAINIPFARLPGRLSSVKKDKALLLVDDSGNESPAAAKILREKGYSNISVLFNGMEGVLQYLPENTTESGISWTPAVAYQTITGEAFDRLMLSGMQVNVVDIRQADEFNNASKDYWRNGGHLKGAVNIPFAELEAKSSSLPGTLKTPLLLYDFSNSNEVYKAAKQFVKKGYNNVYVLNGGLFGMRWRAANLKGKSGLKDWVADVPEENR